MKYNIKQKISFITDKFVINDSNDNNIFIVESQNLTIGKRKIYNLENKELMYIEQQSFTFFPEYKIFKDNNIIAKLKREFALFKTKINIETENDKFRVEGDLRGNYKINKNGDTIATIDKQKGYLDNYNININDNEDQLCILTFIITIDMIFN